MSKLSSVNKSIEALEKAEEALMDTRRAFYEIRKIGESLYLPQSSEHEIIASIFEGVGDAKEILRQKILAPLEKYAFDAKKQDGGVGL